MKNVCVHFCGIGVECCKAGVHLRQTFDDSTPGIGLRIPCIQDGKDSRMICEKLRLPSPEELAAEEQKIDALLERYEKVGPMVNELKARHRNDPDGWAGVEKCPVCGGKLHLAISGYNGHAKGLCETDGCISFME